MSLRRGSVGWCHAKFPGDARPVVRVVAASLCSARRRLGREARAVSWTSGSGRRAPKGCVAGGRSVRRRCDLACRSRQDRSPSPRVFHHPLRGRGFRSASRQQPARWEHNRTIAIRGVGADVESRLPEPDWLPGRSARVRPTRSSLAWSSAAAESLAGGPITRGDNDLDVRWSLSRNGGAATRPPQAELPLSLPPRLANPPPPLPTPERPQIPRDDLCDLRGSPCPL